MEPIRQPPAKRTTITGTNEFPTLKEQTGRDEMLKMWLPEPGEMPATHKSQRYIDKPLVAGNNDDGWQPNERKITSGETIKSESRRRRHACSPKGDAGFNKRFRSPLSVLDRYINKEDGKLCEKSPEVRGATKPHKYNQRDNVVIGDVDGTENKEWFTWISLQHLFKGEECSTPERQRRELAETTPIDIQDGSGSFAKRNLKRKFIVDNAMPLMMRNDSPIKQCEAVSPRQIRLTTPEDSIGITTITQLTAQQPRPPKPDPPINFGYTEKPSYLDTYTIEEARSLSKRLPPNDITTAAVEASSQRPSTSTGSYTK